MKKLLLLVCAVMCMAAAAYSQTILKTKLPLGPSSAATVVDTTNQYYLKLYEALDKINKGVDDFKKKPDSANLKKVMHAVLDTIVAVVPKAVYLRNQLSAIDTTDKKKFVAAVDSLQKKGINPLVVEDTIKRKADSAAAVMAAAVAKGGKDSTVLKLCPKLAVVGLKYLAYNDGYLGVLTDTLDNAMASFVLQQDNKELFYDKLRKSLNGLCDSSRAVDSIIARYRRADPDLYTRFLEAKADLANTNGLAGKLYIRRDVLLRGLETIGNEEDIAEDSAYQVPYPNIRSIRRAKREADRSIEDAMKVQKELEALAAQADTAAKTDTEHQLADRIKRMAGDAKRLINSGVLQLDSINAKVPDYRIIKYYNRAIQMFRMVQWNARRARSVMRGYMPRTVFVEPLPRMRRNEEAFVAVQPVIPKLAGLRVGEASAGGAAYKAAINMAYLLDTSRRDTVRNRDSVRRVDSVKRVDSLKRVDSIRRADSLRRTDSVSKDAVRKADSLVLAETGKPPANFIIQSVRIQFQDGFIENIMILGRRKGGKYLYKFENTYPIGFSTKRDFRNLIDVDLYEKSDHNTLGGLSLNLGEVLRYDENFAVYNKDFSPANQVLNVDALTDSIKEIALYKDQTSKILELRVFSDLKGTDESNPNGLIQIELNKRLNLFSRRRPLRLLGAGPARFEPIANQGWFNFVTPQFSINKIENNQKRLLLDQIDTLTLAADSSKPISYASTINLLKHQVYRVGFDLSIFLMDMPNLKSTIDLGVGVHFGRSALQDSVRVRNDTILPPHVEFVTAAGGKTVEYGVNTFQWGPYFTWQIFPDSRFGISGTQRFTWYKALTSSLVQVRDSAHYLSYIAGTPREEITRHGYTYNHGSIFTKCIASSEIFAYWNPNSDGSNKIFFRYRLNWDLANSHENYHQIQVGFSTYLTATKEFAKLKKSSGVDF